MASFANRRKPYHFLLMMPRRKQTNRIGDHAHPKEHNETPESAREAAVLALFRLLMREPPPDHDFRTCPLCKRYGITGI
jgi:hypothetical protein